MFPLAARSLDRGEAGPEGGLVPGIRGKDDVRPPSVRWRSPKRANEQRLPPF